MLLEDNGSDNRIIGFTHRADKSGGPGSFQTRLIAELRKRACKIVYPEDNIVPSVVLVIGGSAKIWWIVWCKIKGARIVHRIDGLNWRHRLIKCPLWYKVKSEVRNWLTLLIRNVLADQIIYQSHFVMSWYNYRYGKEKVKSVVIYNFVDSQEFFPTEVSPQLPPKIICAESRLVDDFISCKTIRYIVNELYGDGLIRGVRVIGSLGSAEYASLAEVPGIELAGEISRREMPAEYRTGEIFLSLDVNAACPNAVIEALASGLVVVGFKTGALPELITSDSGLLVDYGGDPWALDEPDYAALVGAITEVSKGLGKLRYVPRRRAEKEFSYEAVGQAYFQVLFGS